MNYTVYFLRKNQVFRLSSGFISNNNNNNDDIHNTLPTISEVIRTVEVPTRIYHEK